MESEAVKLCGHKKQVDCFGLQAKITKGKQAKDIFITHNMVIKYTDELHSILF